MSKHPGGIAVFFLEPTDREKIWLRRFTWSEKHKCTVTGHYCNGMTYFGEHDIRYANGGYDDSREDLGPPRDDARWPTKCDHCGRAFTEEDQYQVHGRQIYTRLSDGFRCTLEEAPPGAIWDAWWISERRKDSPTGCGFMVGPDHRSLVVRCPDGHDWMIDSRASNCTKKEDNTHHCWVRHGRPEDGTLHVDKNGNTCSAGAGSIDTGKWHGYLHNGELHT